MDKYKTVCKKVVAWMLKPFNMDDRIRKISEIRCEELFEVVRVGGPVSAT